MKFRIFFSAFVISTLLYACNNNNSFSDNTTEETPVGRAETPKSAIKGQVIFEQKCAACHGSNGAAGIGHAANLKTSKLDGASIANIITDGKGGMPSFGAQLTREEIADISSYVLMLHK